MSCTGPFGKMAHFEVIDGQQRTISVCQFVEGDFAFRDGTSHDLQKDEQVRKF